MSASYWQSVVEAGLHLPTDRSLDDLTTELVDMLGNPDPRFRDDIAYPLLATWIHAGEYDRLLHGFGDGMAPGLRNGLGNDGDESVLRRSYSALVLAEIVSRDNDEELLDGGTVLGWGDLATSWLVRERDLRGWIDGHGWSHAVAHGADLVGVLARSRHFGPLELTVLLDVVADRLLAATRYVLHHGEPDRLAYAVMAVLHRGLLAPAVLEPWLARVGAATRMPQSRGQSHLEWPTPPAANTSAFLRALYLQLAVGVRGRSDLRSDDQLFGDPPAHRADLLLAVVDQLRAENPWLFQSPARRRMVPSAP